MASKPGECAEFLNAQNLEEAGDAMGKYKGFGNLWGLGRRDKLSNKRLTFPRPHTYWLG